MTEEKNNDLGKLIGFLKESEDILEKLIKKPDGLFLKKIITNKSLQKDIHNAWQEVKKTISVAIEHLHSPDSQKISIKLNEVGLTGAQLQLKINLFNWFRKKYISEKTRNWLIRLLGVMNSILGSFSKACPFVEPFKEFKELVEQIVKMK